MLIILTNIQHFKNAFYQNSHIILYPLAETKTAIIQFCKLHFQINMQHISTILLNLQIRRPIIS